MQLEVYNRRRLTNGTHLFACAVPFLRHPHSGQTKLDGQAESAKAASSSIQNATTFAAETAEFAENWLEAGEREFALCVGNGPPFATSRTSDLDVCSWKRGTARVRDFAVELTDVGLGNEASEGSERANQHDDRGKKEPSHTSLRCGRWQCYRLSLFRH
jgi:hypothetical protein